MTRFLIILIPIFLWSCGEKAATCDQLFLEGGLYKHPADNVAFTGEANCYYESGELKYEREYTGGKLSGEWSEFDEAGNYIRGGRVLTDEDVRGWDDEICLATGADWASFLVWKKDQESLMSDYMTIILASPHELDTTSLRYTAWFSQYKVEVGGLLRHIYVEQLWSDTTSILDLEVNAEFYDDMDPIYHAITDTID